jgi:hypothetical protein
LLPRLLFVGPIPPLAPTRDHLDPTILSLMHAFIHGFKHSISAISNHSVPLLSMKELFSRHQSQKERWGVRRAHVQPRLLTRSFAIDQTLGTAFVEVHDPVPGHLERHIAEAGGIGTRASIVDRGECQQTSCLGCVLRLPRQSPQTGPIKIHP